MEIVPKKIRIDYSYQRVPTLKRFAQCNKRVRGAMGPFGCLSADTEFLTPSGWKRIDQYEEGDLVAQYVPDKGGLEFVEPLEYFKLPCDEFYHVKNAYSIDQMLSAEHRVLYKRFGGKLAVLTAEELAQKHNSLKDGFHGKFITTFAPPEREGIDLSEAQLRLMVAVIADGHFPAQTRRCSITVRKERKKVRLRKLLAACGLSWEERHYASRPTELLFLFEAPLRQKEFDGAFWHCTPAQLQVIAEEVPHWDGHVDYWGGIIFSTTSWKSADFVQYVYSSVGRRTTIAEVEYKNGAWRKGYRVLAAHATPLTSLRSAPPIERVPSPDGFKYCFTVPSSFFVTRRNYRIVVTGNSGKSSAMLWEIIRRGHEQKPGRDGIRRTRWAVVRNCYDDQTEILTESRGWQLFKDLREGEKVATLKEGKMVFEAPSYYYAARYTGEMIGIGNDSMDLLVTPDHKLYVSRINGRTKGRSEWLFQKAQDIYGRTNYEFTMESGWEGKPPGYPVDFFEFLGFWFAEGYAGIYRYGRDHYRLVVSQKNHTAYTEGLLLKAGLRYGKYQVTNGFQYSIRMNDFTRYLTEELRRFGKSKTKYLPQWIKEAPPEHLRAFLHGYIMGDGKFRGYKKETTRFYTASKSLADDLQEIALKAGYGVIVRKHLNREEYILTLLTNGRMTPQPKQSHWYRQEYDGMVYCVEVSTHIVMVRRGGKPLWCSQTYPQLKDTTIRTVLDWLPPTIFGNHRVADHEYVITGFKDCHIELMFRALDKPEHVSNLLSLELTGGWINEAREVPKPIIDALDGRIDRYPSVRDGGCTWTGLIMDTNPPDEDSWWYKYFELDKPENAELFKQPSGLSPEAENIMTWKEYEQYERDLEEKGESLIIPGLKPDYYTNLAMGKPDDFVRVYVKGQYGFVKEGKPVYEHSWNEDIHVAKETIRPIQGREIILAFDFGLTPACAVCQITPRGYFNVLDELTSDGMGLQQFIKNLLAPLITSKYHGFPLIAVGDPAGEQRAQSDEKSCVDILRQEEFKNIRLARTNALVARIGAVEAFLSRLTDGRPTFQLDPGCRVIRKGFNGGYRYRKIHGSDNKYSPEPEKNFFSHIMNALEYAALHVGDGIRNAARPPRVRRRTYQPASTAGY
ncbi:MAG: hypothetical protein K8I29_19585 [Alphaproteobacteria bacterium]|uniref:DOD-type homing endonuclease domain-containing protein n=1 Tax=Candidatus Nitrobium versatile TaxID=2884831 RepID=A0A953M3U9_9BACT|nr:hypothetical protein [Candidatus Nitrobium versatile]